METVGAAVGCWMFRFQGIHCGSSSSFSFLGWSLDKLLVVRKWRNSAPPPSVSRSSCCMRTTLVRLPVPVGNSAAVFPIPEVAFETINLVVSSLLFANPVLFRTASAVVVSRLVKADCCSGTSHSVFRDNTAGLLVLCARSLKVDSLSLCVCVYRLGFGVFADLLVCVVFAGIQRRATCGEEGIVEKLLVLAMNNIRDFLVQGDESLCDEFLKTIVPASVACAAWGPTILAALQSGFE